MLFVIIDISILLGYQQARLQDDKECKNCVHVKRRKKTHQKIFHVPQTVIQCLVSQSLSHSFQEDITHELCAFIDMIKRTCVNNIIKVHSSHDKQFLCSQASSLKSDIGLETTYLYRGKFLPTNHGCRAKSAVTLPTDKEGNIGQH